MTTDPIRRLASDQHGLVTRSQLLNAGVRPHTVDHWVESGRLLNICDLIRYDGPIEITAATKRTRPGLIVHRKPLTQADITHHWGIAVTSPAQ